VAPAGGGGGPSSGTSFTPTSELSFGVPVTGNVLMGLPYIVTAGTGLNVTYDKTGRITSTAASIDTTLVTGVWTSGVSSGNVQGLGSTWTVSRISSDRSILANEVWASGFSGLGSIATVSRISSNVSVVANEVWASGVSVASLITTSRLSSSATIVANEVWASGVSVGSIVTTSYVSSGRTVMGTGVWSSGFSGPHLSVLTVREGGTGYGILSVGDLLFGWSASSFSILPVGASGLVLKARSDGTVEWGSAGAAGSAITFWEAMSMVALGF